MVDRSGKVVNSYNSMTSPQGSGLVADIEKLLQVLMEKLRIGQRLWAARFFKTWQFGSGTEIDKGHVVINDAVAKPSRAIKAGDLVQVETGDITRTVTVLQVSADKRGPAPIAALLYQETEQSQHLRLQAAQQRRLVPEPAVAHLQGRPTKRERRTGDKLRAGEWDARWSASADS